MIARSQRQQVERRLQEAPVVAILGARQVGKTTLAGEVAAHWDGTVHRFDLEDPADLARLTEPGLALRGLEGLVVLDEIQRSPALFNLLRVLADRRPLPARFIVLGSASPDVVRGVSESLAGRVAFVFLEGLGLEEVGLDLLPDLWLRGGFPRSFLANSDEQSERWRLDFMRTFLERDLPQLDFRVPAATMRRFWTMLAHNHGQLLNASAIGRSLGVGDHAVRRYLDMLAGTFMVRVLPPWLENVAKRQVKRPKVYLNDSGLLHSLLGLGTATEAERHPILGASWEGFALQQTIRRLGARPESCFFWATHAGAELDLLVVQGGKRLGFEFKRTETPRRTRSMYAARQTLGLDRLDVVHGGAATFPLGDGVRALALGRLLVDLAVV
jgi:hypothetical protein